MGKYLITFCDDIKSKTSKIGFTYGVFLNYL